MSESELIKYLVAGYQALHGGKMPTLRWLSSALGYKSPAPLAARIKHYKAKRESRVLSA